jgi:hypothetical protein
LVIMRSSFVTPSFKWCVLAVADKRGVFVNNY